jgi:hypothetical protein
MFKFASHYIAHRIPSVENWFRQRCANVVSKEQQETAVVEASQPAWLPKGSKIAGAGQICIHT